MFGWNRVNYRDILDSMTDGMYFVVLYQMVRYWNKAAELLTGITSAQIIGKVIDGGY
ncbi:MAG: PAS domain S-box protein, partial [Nitrospirae bacterium]|nr:PAS domain S-box protein [Nitrospirota bacterium]